MKKVLEINDLKVLAKKKLPKMFYDYVDSGSYTESTYIENETDFNKIKLRQRVGRDISASKLSKKFLEKEYNNTNNAQCVKVEVWEHEGNSAIYGD